jgi:hypothetical protein
MTYVGMWRGRSGSGLARSIASQTSLAESQHCHFAFVAELFMCGPPGRGDFWFQIFIQAPSRKLGQKREEVRAGKWGGLFLGYLLGRNYRRRDRDRLVPLRWMDAAVYRAEVRYPFGGKHGSH